MPNNNIMINGYNSHYCSIPAAKEYFLMYSCSRGLSVDLGASVVLLASPFDNDNGEWLLVVALEDSPLVFAKPRPPYLMRIGAGLIEEVCVVGAAVI